MDGAVRRYRPWRRRWIDLHAESVPARTCAGYALSTRAMKWAPWSTLNGSLTRRAEIDEAELSLSDESVFDRAPGDG